MLTTKEGPFPPALVTGSADTEPARSVEQLAAGQPASGPGHVDPNVTASRLTGQGGDA